MMASIYAKLAGVLLILALFAGTFLWGDHHGTAKVQAQWDAAKVVQQVAVAKAEAASAAQAKAQQESFNTLEAKYETAIQPAPLLSAALPAALAAGTLQLRDPTVCPSRGDVSAATAASRAADAAATQALADRATNSIAAVRIGDAADARERQLDAQIVGLQGLLKAERQPTP